MRISFGGGGTDLEAYYAGYGGLVISAAINKYFYAIITTDESDDLQVISAYEHVFAEQLANMIEPGDVAIGISTSGNSHNMINALHLTKQLGGVTIGLLGAEGGEIKDIVDAYVLAPGQNIEQEEDAHMILAHIITRYMRAVVHKVESSASVSISLG